MTASSTRNAEDKLCEFVKTGIEDQEMFENKEEQLNQLKETLKENQNPSLESY